MCVKLPLRDLNPDPYPSHLTSTYTYGVTTASRVHGDYFCLSNYLLFSSIEDSFPHFHHN